MGMENFTTMCKGIWEKRIWKMTPYLYVVFIILGSPLFRLSHISWRNAPLDDYVREFSNVVPLHGIIESITKAIEMQNTHYIFTLLANFLVMIPVGLFYGYSMQRSNLKEISFICARYAGIFGILYCVRILLKMGSFDIDDILLNVVGMYFGIILASQRKQKSQN